jgi:carbonic anhydrase
MGLVDNWLRHVQDIRERHQELFTRAMTDAQSIDRLGELNVLEQVVNVCRTTILSDAWKRGQAVTVHGWIYSLKDGIVRDLGMAVAGEGALTAEYDRALAALNAGSK